MNPKLVIFDVDGLMLDTEARWQEAWQKVGERYCIEDFFKMCWENRKSCRRYN